MKTKNFLKQDIFSAFAFIVFGSFLIFFLIPVGIIEPGNVDFSVLSPSYYPRLISYILIFIGIGILIKNFTSGFFEKTNLIENKYLVRMMIVLALIFFIIFMLPILGIPIVSVFSILFLMLLGGERRPIIIACVSILAPLFIYLFFTKVAQIPIPNGLFERLI